MSLRNTPATLALLGIGVALTIVALNGSRYMGQRVLYIAAGVLFIIAAVVRIWQAKKTPAE